MATRSRTTLDRRPAASAVAALVLGMALALAGCAPGAQTTVYATPSGAASPSAAALTPEVSVEEALAIREAGAFVLDVREPDEWAAGHIPGATLISLGQLADRTSEVPTDRDVLVVCRSGNRSAQGRDILRAAGLTRVTSMAGGMTEWAEAGNPIETGP
jgi:rhodanese-related sulfurtransferase